MTKIGFEASLEKLGKRLPLPIKRFLMYPLGTFMRFGKIFWETYYFLQESQWWSREKLEEYQMQELNKLLHHAYENVPYYRQIFRERRLKPRDIHNLDDLRKLPRLDKDTVKFHLNEMMAKNVNPRDLHARHTGGTTGKPVQFYGDYSETEKEWAFVSHQWSRVGYRPGELLVHLGGPVILGKNPVDYDPRTRVMRLSPRINTKEVAQYYIRLMKSFAARFLHGYPSAIASFAQMVRKHSLVVPFNLKAVLFASEAVYDWEREIVQETFECRVFAHYGQAELIATASECEHSHYYHFVPQYGITEIDPDTHEIIATGFVNFVNPLIRYKMLDFVSPVFSKCDHCYRNYFPIVERVEGRLNDFFVTRKGELISGTAISWCFIPINRKYLGTIKESQLIQTSVDNIVYRVVPYGRNSPNIRKADLQRLRQDLQKILGSNIQIKLEVVDDIERSKSGKFRRVASEVSKEVIEKGLDGF